MSQRVIGRVLAVVPIKHRQGTAVRPRHWWLEENESMDLGLRGLNCVVLGASRGIGRAIALALAGEGANMALCARGEAGLAAAAADVAAAGAVVHAAACDIGNPAALGDFLDGARAALGSVDVLVHNASALAGGPELACWEPSLRVDLMAAIQACERVVPWMTERGGGSILLVSSISGLEATPTPDLAYTTVKAALIAYAKKLAVMHGGKGIRVNAIAPGSVDFPGGFWDGVRQGDPGLYQSVRTSIPAGRFGTPGEIADVAAFLVSRRARWINGECVAVDGAQHRAIR